MAKRLPWEQDYAADWLNEETLAEASLEVWGAWHKTILRMRMEQVHELTLTVRDWARFWNCTRRRAELVIAEIKGRKVAEVRACNAHVTGGACNSNVTAFPHSNDSVTLISRRRRKEANDRQRGALRVQRHRGRQTCNAPVTGENQNQNHKKKERARVTHDVTPQKAAEKNGQPDIKLDDKEASAEIVSYCCGADKSRDDVAWRLAVLYGDAGKTFGIAPKGSAGTVGRWLGEFWPEAPDARESDALFQYVIRRFIREVQRCETKAAEKPIWETILAKKRLANIARLRDEFQLERARGGEEAALRRREREAADYEAAAAHRVELAKNFSDGQAVEHPEWGRGVVHMSGTCEDARVEFEIESIPGAGERMRTRLIDIADELTVIELGKEVEK